MQNTVSVHRSCKGLIESQISHVRIFNNGAFLQDTLCLLKQEQIGKTRSNFDDCNC